MKMKLHTAKLPDNIACRAKRGKCFQIKIERQNAMQMLLVVFLATILNLKSIEKRVFNQLSTLKYLIYFCLVLCTVVQTLKFLIARTVAI